MSGITCPITYSANINAINVTQMNAVHNMYVNIRIFGPHAHTAGTHNRLGKVAEQLSVT